MRKLIATTALALIIGGPAAAQTQTQDQQVGDQQQAGQDQQTAQQPQAQNGQMDQQMAGQDFYQPQPNDLFVSDLMDAEVYAPSRDEAAAQQGEQQQDAAAVGTDEAEDDGAEVTVEVEDAEGDTAQETVTTEDDADTDAQVATETETETEGDQQTAIGAADDAEQEQDAAADDQQQMQQQDMAADPQMQQPGEGLQARTISQDELEGMDNIGAVSDVIIDDQGEIRAVVLDVGGFLGIGAREVALSTDQIEFGYDQENPDQFYIISQVTAEELENAPEFDRDQLREQREQGAGVADDDQQQQDAAVGVDQQQQDDPAAQDQAAAEDGQQQNQQWRGDRQAMAAPAMEREGYQQAEPAEITADNLLGANVYDVNDENIGSVSDIVMGSDGQAEYAVIDIGGFLGLGTHTVAIGFDEMQVLHDDGWSDLRVYVDATQDELENMPEYEETAAN